MCHLTSSFEVEKKKKTLFLKRPEQGEVKGKMCCLPKIYKVNFQRTTKISSFEDAFILRYLISFSQPILEGWENWNVLMGSG